MMHLLTFARVAVFILRLFRLWYANKAYSFLNDKRSKALPKQGGNVLICTFIADYSFRGNNHGFDDPYFANLIKFYRRIGVKTDIIAMPFLPVHILKKIYKSDKEIILSISFLKLTDILKSAAIGIFFKLHNKFAPAGDLNLNKILEYELIQEKVNVCYSFLQYYTWFNVGENFKKTSYKAFIYFFENQPWEKMMLLGMRNAGMGCKIIGYQHTVVPPLLLNYFVGEKDRNTMPQPDIIVSNGEFFHSVLVKAGYNCKIENGGSIRFSHRKEDLKSDFKTGNNGEKKEVLVVLSPFLYRSMDLLFFIFKVSSNNLGITFLIKAHPDLPEKDVRKHIGNLPSNVIFIDGSMNDLLDRVDFAIHVGSAAAIECLMKGVRTIKYLQELIDLDPLLGMDSRQDVVTDSDLPIFIFSKELGKPISSFVIAEPFREELWEKIAN